jgi:hypothetical protein
MAIYRYAHYLQQSSHAAFDALWTPGQKAEHSGIYRCEHCGKNVASNYGDPLPPQNHHQHLVPGPIRWRLVVATH